MTRLPSIFVFLLMIAGQHAVAQSAWPSDFSYVGYTLSNQSAIQDPSDVNVNHPEFDMVFETGVAPYSVLIASTTSTVFFRLQVLDITQWRVGTYLLFISNSNGVTLGKTYLTLTATRARSMW